jgi:hypothetical protein
MEHAISVTTITESNTIQLTCRCDEQIAGKNVEVLQTWAEAHLRAVEPEQAHVEGHTT